MGFQAAVSLTEQIAEHLGSQIISGALQPLERIQELKVAASWVCRVARCAKRCSSWKVGI